MRPAIVELSYTQQIDATMPGAFEKAVLKASYDEFILKSQAYNKEAKHKTFKEMVAADGRANSLHYKCAFPIGPFVQQLNSEIPGLTDNTGKPLRFASYTLNLIDSDIANRLAHHISITYTTGELTLLDNTQEHFLLAEGEPVDGKYSGVYLLKIVPGLSIHSYKALVQESVE